MLRLLESQRLVLRDCSGLGLAMPGIVDPAAKRVLSMKEKYPDAFDFDFEGWVRDTFGLPLVMENDAKAALLGEVHFGSAKGAQNAVLMIFGTGIGTAAMLGGQLVRGSHHLGGNLGGHFIVEAKGELCNCGARGCLERHAGHWALPLIAKNREGFPESALAKRDEIDFKAVLEAARDHDPFALSLLDELIMYWSAGIVNMVHAFDPDVVILSGGPMKSADVLLPRLTERIRAASWAPWDEIRFVVPADPDSSVLLGLSSLL